MLRLQQFLEKWLVKHRKEYKMLRYLFVSKIEFVIRSNRKFFKGNGNGTASSN